MAFKLEWMIFKKNRIKLQRSRFTNLSLLIIPTPSLCLQCNPGIDSVVCPSAEDAWNNFTATLPRAVWILCYTPPTCRKYVTSDCLHTACDSSGTSMEVFHCSPSVFQLMELGPETHRACSLTGFYSSLWALKVQSFSERFIYKEYLYFPNSEQCRVTAS